MCRQILTTFQCNHTKFDQLPCEATPVPSIPEYCPYFTLEQPYVPTMCSDNGSYCNQSSYGKFLKAMDAKLDEVEFEEYLCSGLAASTPFKVWILQSLVRRLRNFDLDLHIHPFTITSKQQGEAIQKAKRILDGVKNVKLQVMQYNQNNNIMHFSGPLGGFNNVPTAQYMPTHILPAQVPVAPVHASHVQQYQPAPFAIPQGLSLPPSNTDAPVVSKIPKKSKKKAKRVKAKRPSTSRSKAKALRTVGISEDEISQADSALFNGRRRSERISSRKHVNYAEGPTPPDDKTSKDTARTDQRVKSTVVDIPPGQWQPPKFITDSSSLQLNIAHGSCVRASQKDQPASRPEFADGDNSYKRTHDTQKSPLARFSPPKTPRHQIIGAHPQKTPGSLPRFSFSRSPVNSRKRARVSTYGGQHPGPAYNPGGYNMQHAAAHGTQDASGPSNDYGQAIPNPLYGSGLFKSQAAMIMQRHRMLDIQDKLRASRAAPAHFEDTRPPTPVARKNNLDISFTDTSFTEISDPSQATGYDQSLLFPSTTAPFDPLVVSGTPTPVPPMQNMFPAPHQQAMPPVYPLQNNGYAAPKAFASQFERGMPLEDPYLISHDPMLGGDWPFEGSHGAGGGDGGYGGSFADTYGGM